MIFEQGKTYILGRDGITIEVKEIGPKQTIMRVVANKEGKIPGDEEDEYLVGPSENFQGWMTYQQAKEVTNAHSRTYQTRSRNSDHGPDNSGGTGPQ